MIAALIPFGWDTQWESDYQAVAGAVGGDSRPGRVARVDRGECDVITQRGVERAVSDQLRSQDAVAPVTGDWVVLRDSPDSGTVVDAVLDRRSTIVRKDPADAAAQQVLAANVDVVAITHGLDRPFSLARVERFLVLAWDSDAEPIVLLTKADLSNGNGDPAVPHVILHFGVDL